jgi:hypothetical protein
MPPAFCFSLVLVAFPANFALAACTVLHLYHQSGGITGRHCHTQPSTSLLKDEISSQEIMVPRPTRPHGYEGFTLPYRGKNLESSQCSPFSQAGLKAEGRWLTGPCSKPSNPMRNVQAFGSDFVCKEIRGRSSEVSADQLSGQIQVQVQKCFQRNP